MYEPKTFPQQPAEFKTKYGNFITNNQGEFGGDMTLPNGKTIGGNYALVFECGEYVYAVSTLSHFTISDFDLVCFDKDLNEKTIYSAHSSGSLYSLIMDELEGEKETYECLYYGANYIYEDTLYVVVIDLEKEAFKLLTVVNHDAEKDLLRKE